jgi:hypothetical protein
MGKKLTVGKTMQAIRLVERMKLDIHNSPLEKSGMQANFLMCAVGQSGDVRWTSLRKGFVL